MPQTTIYNMDVLQALAKLPDNSVDCIVTSPPYYGLRNYGREVETIWDADIDCQHSWGDVIPYAKEDKRTPAQKRAQGATVGNSVNSENFAIGNSGQFCLTCGAWKGQLGLEPKYEWYLEHLKQITQGCWRVLKDSGTVFWNMGDSYASKGGASRHKGYTDPKYPNGRDGSFDEPTSYPQGNIRAKSLMQIPERFAIEVVDEQRWILRNTIIWNKPNAMPTSANDRFSGDYEYIFFFVKQEDYYFKQQLEPYTKPLNRWGGDVLKAEGQSTWDKGTGQDTYRNRDMRPNPEGRNKRAVWEINTEPYAEAHFACYPTELVSQCLKAGCPDKGTVLDPFAGSGTTLQVAREMGLDNIGIEINPNYIQIIKKRLKANEWLNREEFKVVGL